jgi:LacI family transcriptional regulator
MAHRRPTIKDVAQRAGVSFKTVSRVINEQRGVSDEVKERVRQAIAELGYVVNYSARSLAAGGSSVVGVVIPRLTDPRSLDLLAHVGEVAERLELGIIVLTRPILDSEIGFSQFIGHGIVGSLLLMSPRSVSAYLPFVRALDIPTVVVESLLEDTSQGAVPCIASDNYGGALAATRYLCELGHRRIAFISGTDLSQNRLRHQGYLDALAEADIAPDASLVQAGRWNWQSGYEAARALIELEAPPTAIFCANDTMALGAILALRERGLRIPGDMSVMGFDDLPAAASSRPPLTTVRQPTTEMVERAFALLEGAKQGEPLPDENQVLPTELVIRASCGPPRR